MSYRNETVLTNKINRNTIISIILRQSWNIVRTATSRVMSNRS